MPFDLSISKSGQSNHKTNNPVDAKKAAMAAAKEAAQKAAGKEPAAGAMIKYIPPGECPDRNRIVFDDSGSMAGEIENAKRGVVEFLRNCIPNQTSVAVHFMNTSPEIDLQSDLVKLGAEISEKSLSSGGTPFFNTLKKALEAKPVLTRLIAFTDGSPTDQLKPESDNSSELQTFYSSKDSWTRSADIIIKIAKAIGEQSASKKCFPIDTVFFGNASWNKEEMDLLKYLSSQTGGFFLHFDPSKPNIWKQLKYLAPVNRLMLASESFRAEVERGKA